MLIQIAFAPHFVETIRCYDTLCSAAMDSDAQRNCEDDTSRSRYVGGGVGKPKMGLVVLQNDYTLEDDARRLLTDGVSLHVTRIKCAAEVSAASLKAMEGHVTEAAELFPEHADFGAVGYGCTSAAAIIGADREPVLYKFNQRTTFLKFKSESCCTESAVSLDTSVGLS